MTSRSEPQRHARATATNPIRRRGRPAKSALFKSLPEQHQPGPVPGQELQSISSLAAENEDRARKRIVPQLLTHQRGKALGAAAKVHRLRRHQHPHSDRNGDHVAARTARSTATKLPGSIPGETRTVAAPITISITGDPAARAGANDTSDAGHARAPSTITGAKAEPLSAL